MVNSFRERSLLTKILRRYASQRQATVIVTSHYLNELEHIVDEVGMIEGETLVIPETGDLSLEQYFLGKNEADENEIEHLFE